MIKMLILGTLFVAGWSRAWAIDANETWTVDSRPNQKTLLKTIVQRLSENLMRAIVIDGDGQERRILITNDSAVEVKRGLWVVRPGTYPLDLANPSGS